MIVINFKTYTEVTDNHRAVDLAKSAQEVFNRYQIPIILCVQATDIYEVASAVSLPIFAQHIDPVEPGKNTGFITALAVKESGAQGVMINHSEHRIGTENIAKAITLAKQEALQTLVCVESAIEASEIDTLYPDMIALEDPVLIGGSVSIVKNIEGKRKVEELAKRNLRAKTLVGAGVKDGQDVRVSLQLGATGVLIASGFDLAPDPKAVLEDLCEGFK